MYLAIFRNKIYKKINKGKIMQKVMNYINGTWCECDEKKTFVASFFWGEIDPVFSKHEVLK